MTCLCRPAAAACRDLFLAYAMHAAQQLVNAADTVHAQSMQANLAHLIYPV